VTTSGKIKQRTVDEYDRLHVGPLRAAANRPGAQAIPTGRPARDHPGTVEHVWDVRRRVLRYAVQHGAIDANPADRVDFSASRATGDHARFEHHPVTAAEVGALSTAVTGNPPEGYDGPALPAYPVYALMVEFMAYTGLRASEVAGLEVGDLVFAPGPRCAVKVQRAKQRRLLPGHGPWCVGIHRSTVPVTLVRCRRREHNAHNKKIAEYIQ
jgi:integrase